MRKERDKKRTEMKVRRNDEERRKIEGKQRRGEVKLRELMRQGDQAK